MSSADDIKAECRALEELLLAKNKRYGDSAIQPIRVLSKAGPVEQILVRIDDKLNRLLQGDAAEDEDLERDLAGYFILLRIAKQRAKEHEEHDTEPPAPRCAKCGGTGLIRGGSYCPEVCSCKADLLVGEQ